MASPVDDTSDQIAGDRFNVNSALVGLCFFSQLTDNNNNKTHRFHITTLCAVHLIALGSSLWGGDVLFRCERSET